MCLDQRSQSGATKEIFQRWSAYQMVNSDYARVSLTLGSSHYLKRELRDFLIEVMLESAEHFPYSLCV